MGSTQIVRDLLSQLERQKTLNAPNEPVPLAAADPMVVERLDRCPLAWRRYATDRRRADRATPPSQSDQQPPAPIPRSSRRRRGANAKSRKQNRASLKAIKLAILPEFSVNSRACGNDISSWG